jgi:hypothetical protein
VYGTVLLESSISIPSFSFDSGIQPIVWDGNKYVFSGPQFNFIADLSVSQTLSTGGQQYFDSVAFSAAYGLTSHDWTIDSSSFPNSLSVFPQDHITKSKYLQDGKVVVGHLEVSSITATNNFESNLAIPEPTSFFLVILTGGVMLIRRKR